MPQIKNTPIGIGFYKKQSWLDNMVKYYSHDLKILPEHVIRPFLETLTEDLDRILFYNNNFAESIYHSLKNIINPLYDPDNYKYDVYDELIKMTAHGSAQDKKGLKICANALYELRLIFQQDKKYIESKFKTQIEALPGSSFEEKYQKFANYIRDIEKTHILQITKIISQRHKE